MRKALKRAVRVLVAAGAFGLVRPAVAQMSAPVRTPAALPATGSIVKTSAQSVTHDAELAKSQGKRDELEVELALLGSASTFAFPLGAKHTGANLELHGFVPTNFVKEQALEIARKHCGVPVVDKLQVNSALSLRTATESANELQRGAAALLADGFADKMAGLEIRSTGPGKIVLNGCCDSYEEKVKISKTLRALNGCCVVDNHLTVKPVQRNGHLVTLVTADGSYTLAAPGAAEPAPPPARSLVDNSKPIGPPVVTPPPILTAAPPKPAKIEVPPPPPLISKKPDPIPPALTATHPPLWQAQNSATTSVAAKSDVPLPPLSPPKPILAPVTPITATSTPPVAAPVAMNSAWPTAAPITTNNASPVASPIATNSTSSLTKVAAFAKDPGSNTGWESKSPEPVERLTPPPPPPVKATPPGGGTWAAAHDTHLGQAAYATTGTVMFEDDPLPEPPQPLARDKAPLLRQKVAAVCGSKAKNVDVEIKPDGKMLVHVSYMAPNEDAALIRQILGLPEMSAPNVKLDNIFLK